MEHSFLPPAQPVKPNPTADRIVNLLNSSYQFPAEYLMIAILLVFIGHGFVSIFGIGKIIIIMGYLFFALELLGPIVSRLDFYDNAINNIERLQNLLNINILD